MDQTGESLLTNAEMKNVMGNCKRAQYNAQMLNPQIDSGLFTIRADSIHNGFVNGILETSTGPPCRYVVNFHFESLKMIPADNESSMAAIQGLAEHGHAAGDTDSPAKHFRRADSMETVISSPGRDYQK